jgi:hypothetical protein
MQMRLPILLRISDPLLQNLLRLLYKLPMQINRIVRNSSLRIVLPEDIIRRLLIILIHLRRVLLPLFRQLMRRSTISTLVCLMCLGSTLVRVFQQVRHEWISTLSKHEDRFPASCRARSRNRSYSASASPL